MKSEVFIPTIGEMIMIHTSPINAYNGLLGIIIGVKKDNLLIQLLPMSHEPSPVIIINPECILDSPSLDYSDDVSISSADDDIYDIDTYGTETIGKDSEINDHYTSLSDVIQAINNYHLNTESNRINDIIQSVLLNTSIPRFPSLSASEDWLQLINILMNLSMSQSFGYDMLIQMILLCINNTAAAYDCFNVNNIVNNSAHVYCGSSAISIIKGYYLRLLTLFSQLLDNLSKSSDDKLGFRNSLNSIEYIMSKLVS